MKCLTHSILIRSEAQFTKNIQDKMSDDIRMHFLVNTISVGDTWELVGRPTKDQIQEEIE